MKEIEGIYDEEILEVVGHIKKSSFYVMAKEKHDWINEKNLINRIFYLVSPPIAFFIVCTSYSKLNIVILLTEDLHCE